MQVDLLTMLGFAATLLFGVLSVFFYLRSRRHRSLSFTHTAVVLQTKAHPEVTIAFRGKQVVNLSRLRVVCWNSGSQEIRWSDIPEGAAPKLVFGGNTRILSAAVPDATEHTGFQIVHIDDRTIQFMFRYLNPGDFGAAEVLFESAGPDLRLVGFVAPVIGGLPTEAERFAPPLGRVEFVTLVAMPLFVAVFGVLLGIRVVLEPNWLSPSAIFGSVGAVGALGLGIFGALANLGNRRHSRLPAAAQSFLR